MLGGQARAQHPLRCLTLTASYLSAYAGGPQPGGWVRGQELETRLLQDSTGQWAEGRTAEGWTRRQEVPQEEAKQRRCALPLSWMQAPAAVGMHQLHAGKLRRDEACRRGWFFATAQQRSMTLAHGAELVSNRTG